MHALLSIGSQALSKLLSGEVLKEERLEVQEDVHRKLLYLRYPNQFDDSEVSSALRASTVDDPLICHEKLIISKLAHEGRGHGRIYEELADDIMLQYLAPPETVLEGYKGVNVLGFTGREKGYSQRTLFVPQERGYMLLAERNRFVDVSIDAAVSSTPRLTVRRSALYVSPDEVPALVGGLFVLDSVPFVDVLPSNDFPLADDAMTIEAYESAQRIYTLEQKRVFSE